MLHLCDDTTHRFRRICVPNESARCASARARTNVKSKLINFQSSPSAASRGETIDATLFRAHDQDNVRACVRPMPPPSVAAAAAVAAVQASAAAAAAKGKAETPKMLRENHSHWISQNEGNVVQARAYTRDTGVRSCSTRSVYLPVGTPSGLSGPGASACQHCIHRFHPKHTRTKAQRFAQPECARMHCWLARWHRCTFDGAHPVN